MKDNAEEFYGASMAIITELFLLLTLVNSASLSLPPTHLLLVKFRPASLYLVLCGKYKHIFKSILKKAFYCVMSNRVEVGREEINNRTEHKWCYILLYYATRELQIGEL